MAEINMQTIEMQHKDRKTGKTVTNYYVPVNERIKVFRAMYPDWSLASEVLELNEKRCVIKAVVRDEAETIRATGLAFESADSSYINKTSYIENCETSAWGRALGCLGIGVDTSIASADEMLIALQQQEANEKKSTTKKPPKPKDAPPKQNEKDFVLSKFDAAIQAYISATGSDDATAIGVIEAAIGKNIGEVTRAELKDKLTLVKQMIDDIKGDKNE